jgi:hypothetical protein
VALRGPRPRLEWRALDQRTLSADRAGIVVGSGTGEWHGYARDGATVVGPFDCPEEAEVALETLLKLDAIALGEGR